MNMNKMTKAKNTSRVRKTKHAALSMWFYIFCISLYCYKAVPTFGQDKQELTENMLAVPLLKGPHISADSHDST